MRSDSFDAIKAVVLSHGNRARPRGTHEEAPEEVVVVFRRPNDNDRAKTTTTTTRDAPSREVPASAVKDEREEPTGVQPRERRDRRGAAGVRRSPRAHASSRRNERFGAGAADASSRVRGAAGAPAAAPASVETARKTQLAAEEPRLSRRRRRGPDEDREEDERGGARETQPATRREDATGDSNKKGLAAEASIPTPAAVSFASLGVAPPTRLPPTAADAKAVTLAVATNCKDTARGEETRPAETKRRGWPSSGARELAGFAAAGAHVGLRATKIPAVAAARLEALARARAAVDARVEEGQGAR